MNHCKNHPRRPLSAESVSLCEQCLSRQRELTGVKKPRLAQHILDKADLSRPASRKASKGTDHSPETRVTESVNQ